MSIGMPLQTIVFHFLISSVGVFSPIVELNPFLNNTVVILWHQIDSYLDYFFRTLYGAMSSEAQPPTNIMSAIMIIVINGYLSAHHVCLL